MLVIAKRSMLFREQVPLQKPKKGQALAELKPVRIPWTVNLRVSMSPQEAPDFLAQDPAFQHAVKFGAIVVLKPAGLAA